MIDGKFPVWGMKDGLPGLAAGRNVLFEVRKVLQQGGLVATLLDTYIGYPLNPNVFRLIRRVGARMVFVVWELQQNGEILVEFLSPPDPFCLSDESVQSNLLFLQERADRGLQLLSLQRRAADLPIEETPSRAREASFELDSAS